MGIYSSFPIQRVSGSKPANWAGALSSQAWDLKYLLTRCWTRDASNLKTFPHHSVYFSRATSWWWGMTFFFTPPSEIKFHAICWRWRSWVKNDGEEGRMMSFFDLGGHCMMLGSKKIIAASQWSFHKTKHMLIKPFFFFTFSPSFIKPHSLASQLSSSKEGWEMTGRHFPFVHMFCFVFHHQAEDR